MNLINLSHLTLAAACCILLAGSATAQDGDELPVWVPDKNVVARLGERFADARMSIRPPRDLKRADRPNPPIMADRGIYNYGWTPGGAFPSLRNLSVGLTPFAKPSSSALDKTVDGMKKAIQRNLQEVEFGEVRRGRFGGIEARFGQYTARICDEKIIAFYLVGIDSQGSFGVSAMLPSSEATAERIQETKASILTFKRAK